MRAWHKGREEGIHSRVIPDRLAVTSRCGARSGSV